MFWLAAGLFRTPSVWLGGRAGVQHESTATGLDAGGPERTRGDGDLHRDTQVDGLPLDGMQEVWGSNPPSSTAGQRPFTKSAVGALPLPEGHFEGQDRCWGPSMRGQRGMFVAH